FDPATIKPLIAKLFGTLPRGATPNHAKADPVHIPEVRRVTYFDNVQFAKIYFVYHSPAMYAAGDADMDLAAAALSDGKSSRLYKRLVYDDKLATDVSALQESKSLGSLFTIEVTAKQGVSLDQIEKVVDEVLAEFIAKGPTPQELERYRAKFEYGT